MSEPIPVVLFAYARPAHLARVLACLRENGVPLICAFADGAKSAADAAGVAETRALLRAIDWCEVRLTERAENLGLGRNVLAGVSEVAAGHEAFVVWEDDLIAVPGTYAWVCAALRQFAADERVMSVTAWTHPRVTPTGLGEAPYFDARAECWVWGAWARSWQGMAGETALEKLAAVGRRGLPADAYGADLPAMARRETRKNIWAVRWLYHHFEHDGLCVRPPWSMVEHIGFDAAATHASAAIGWANFPLRAAPPVPTTWPVVAEHPDCRSLWRAAAGAAAPGLGTRLRRAVRRVIPAAVLVPVQERFFRVRWTGDYPDWAAAQAAGDGYAAATILEKVAAAARAVRAGAATYERDGVVFHEEPPWWPGLAVLRDAAAARGGKLTVLDFGGSFGSAYFQVKSRLGARELHWRVVEQLGFVAVGRREFQGAELEFYSSIREACAAGMPDVVLLASVLPYLPSPAETFSELLQIGAAWLLVDRTGFTTDGGTRLTIQRVPRAIYRASYPCWFLDRTELLRQSAAGYRVLADFREDIAVPAGLEFRSLQLARLT
ncbi:MAG: methyltransferase, TIGR04325 family [Opitutus sp.]|nr:methyltransferase, TIGR04325 family [Opitutus sp.]